MCSKLFNLFGLVGYFRRAALVLEIKGLNKCRKPRGFYLSPEELRFALEEAYLQAINRASLGVEERCYEPDELEQLINKEEILDCALALILPSEYNYLIDTVISFYQNRHFVGAGLEII